MKGLGERIRNLRKAKHLTIVEVAKSTGIDQATLSRIENGKMTGTLDSHRRIAEALGIRLGELYESVMNELAKSSDKRAERRLESFSHSSGATAQLLTAGVLQKKMMPVLIKFRAKGHTEIEELPAGSERFIYVLRGGVILRLGSTKRLLRQGESTYFPASTPHSFRNPVRQESVVLSVITPTSL